MIDEISSEAEIEAAWQKARPIPGHDSRIFRVAPDVLRSVIRRDRFGIRGKYGWRIEYGRPVPFHRLSMESAMRRVERDLRRAPGRQTGAANI